MNCYNSLTASTLFRKYIRFPKEPGTRRIVYASGHQEGQILLCLWHQGFRLLPEGRFTSSEISFGNIRFDGRGMSADEQKHYLYDHVFKALNASLGYEDFKKRLAEESIRVTEHVNSKGAYGISFYMETWKMLMSLKVRIFPVSSLIRISRSISMVWLSVSRHISIG